MDDLISRKSLLNNIADNQFANADKDKALEFAHYELMWRYVNSFPSIPVKTNGDMIRRMDNYNLAEWIADRYCPPGQKKQLFRQSWLDWLNKEVDK